MCTYCEDGTFTLPVKYNIHHYTDQITVVYYSLPYIAIVHFTVDFLVSRTKSETYIATNPCSMYKHFTMTRLSFESLALEMRNGTLLLHSLNILIAIERIKVNYNINLNCNKEADNDNNIKCGLIVLDGFIFNTAVCYSVRFIC